MTDSVNLEPAFREAGITNFLPREFACKCGKCGGKNLIVVDFVMDLQELRTRAARPLIISSGYRCPQHVSEKKKSAPGPHQTGLAADIVCFGDSADFILKIVYDMGLFRGKGIHQKGDVSSRFLHVDQAPTEAYRQRPWIWSY